MVPAKDLKSLVIMPFWAVMAFCFVFFLSSAQAVETGAKSDDSIKKMHFSKDIIKKDDSSPVELNGDQMEFRREINTFIVEGNVVMTKGPVRLTCDRVEYSKDTHDAHAEGHVVLSSPEGIISGDKMNYNFDKMAGEMINARISASPYYGVAPKVAKLDQNHLVMEDGYLTTCDHDKPHFRLASRKLDVYPGDKIIARNMRMILGNIPVAWIPRFSQPLDDRKPRVIYTPGFRKQWGAFLLQDWRYYVNDYWRGSVHLDYRDRKGFAPGFDANYKIPGMGSGIIRLYYMNELNVSRKYPWSPKTAKTIYRERFKGEWRHKWTIDPQTEAVWQYFKLSDKDFLKDYFPKEYDKDNDPQSFFVVTRNLPNGTLSFNYIQRINRFDSYVERLPEIRYDLTNQRIGTSNFYLKSQNSYVNLSKKDPSPTEIRRNTMRVDSDNIVSYPMKISFIEFTPHVGGRETYYSKTMNPGDYSVVRGLFETGADLSTKFYKIYDFHTNVFGLDINRLRHIITPSIAYVYQPDPTILPSELDNFDSVDGIQRDHSIEFNLENKLQTKRNGLNIDLVRNVLTADFRLKEYPGKGGFDHVKSKTEVKPLDWITFSSDTDYDTVEEHLNEANFDMYINGGDKWSLGLGKRYNRDVDDQITTEFRYKINPKWRFGFYDRFDVGGGGQKEQEFTITRDLHEWEMDINFNETRGQGSELWLVFRLKAFPQGGIDLSTSYHQRKLGSQSSTGQ